jgi:phage-related protein (TIGR01555 family)
MPRLRGDNKGGVRQETVDRLKADERKVVEAYREAQRAKAAPAVSVKDGDLVIDERTKSILDSFQNFALNLGVGTDNALAGSTYGFNPLTRQRTILEWMYRGSWLAGVAIDIPAEDMTRAGVDIRSTVAPDDIETLDQENVRLGTWQSFADVIKWGRLYGGAIGVYLIDGQRLDTPLRVETVGRGQFRGIMALDRWMLEPSMQDLVGGKAGEEFNARDLGLPRFYKVTVDAPALRGQKIHYTRCFRVEGVKLPFWQRVMENLWGISVYERIYDRLVAFDSSTQGAAQLVYKSFIRTYAIDRYREILGAGGTAEAALIKGVDMMRRFQGIEGITLIDGKDEFIPNTFAGFTGISDVLVHLGEQLSGALEIPVVRLFGQSPKGLNATGESDLRTYYDGIALKQNRDIKVPVVTTYRLSAASAGVKLGDKFDADFAPLWQLTDEQRAQVTTATTGAILDAEERGVISPQVALKELRQQSRTTGVFSNISDDDIENAESEPAPTPEELQHEATMTGIESGERTAEMSAQAKAAGGNGKGNVVPFRRGDAALDGKVSQASVRYRPGVPGRFCGECTMVMPPHSCSHVAGIILARGTCDDFVSAVELAILRKSDRTPTGDFQGIPIVVEFRKGDVRFTHGDQPMPADYGYIRRVPSAEGPEAWLDCMIGDHPESARAVIINHYGRDGEFEELKVMLGFADLQEAMNAYRALYPDNPPSPTAPRVMRIDELKAWLATGDVIGPIGPGGTEARPLQ